MKYMKDIIRKESMHLFKSVFLNRKAEQEEKRSEIYKELTGLGMRPYKAYQISIRRMKI
tara:strand:- start:158 stop:334 length:177 start_codon:yes stop_codon:yes gene_type:complete